jgi:cytochrome c oxidase subunit 3
MHTLKAPSMTSTEHLHAEDGVPVAHHFDSAQQQKEAVQLGIWFFLATEIMFFGGAFAVYAIYRHEFGDAFHAASRTLDLTLGTINTFILLTSSLTMALTVAAAKHNSKAATIGWMLATMVLGSAFLVVKGFEYAHKYHEHHLPAFGLPFEWPAETAKGAQLFISLYLSMTSLHALHMIIGIGMMAVFVVMLLRARNAKQRSVGVELLGLYWHFVDLVWIYLFPLMYLIDRSAH